MLIIRFEKYWRASTAPRGKEHSYLFYCAAKRNAQRLPMTQFYKLPALKLSLLTYSLEKYGRFFLFRLLVVVCNSALFQFSAANSKIRSGLLLDQTCCRATALGVI